MGGKRPYGSGGDVVQCSSSSSMNETTKGKPQNRDGRSVNIYLCVLQWLLEQ